MVGDLPEKTSGALNHTDAVIDGGHALYLIVDAADRERVARYMEPFARAGKVSVMPASHCQVVVNRAAIARFRIDGLNDLALIT